MNTDMNQTPKQLAEQMASELANDLAMRPLCDCSDCIQEHTKIITDRFQPLLERLFECVEALKVHQKNGCALWCAGGDSACSCGNEQGKTALTALDNFLKAR